MAREYAGQSQRRDVARTYLTADEARQVLGHYTLVAGQVEHGTATETVRAGTSRNLPIPVCLVARLAVDKRVQGQGIGSALLSMA